VAYRRVRLGCGADILSEADNWYLPDRLTPDMNRKLDQTDTPFGLAVRPLNFSRRTLAAKHSPDVEHVLEIRAVLVSASGAPFSYVVEDYTRNLALTPGR
jgi:chorismate-pyruvate lyase